MHKPEVASICPRTLSELCWDPQKSHLTSKHALLALKTDGLLPPDALMMTSHSDAFWHVCASVQILRLLRVLGQGSAESSEAMSDILAQVGLAFVGRC